MTERFVSPHPSQSPEPTRRWVTVVVLSGIVALTAVAFWPALSNGFVHLDDPAYIMSNDAVKRGLTIDGLAWAFTAVHAGYWHPLTWLSHMLDVRLFGMNAAGHHAMSLAIHALNAALVLLVFRRMTGSLWASAAVAALFAVHPLRVESVAWAAERKDVLSALFGLLAIWFYASYAARPRPGPYLLTALMMSLSLMAKPMLVTLPLLLLLLDVWPLRRLSPHGSDEQVEFVPASSGPRVLVEKLPLLAISLAASLVVCSRNVRPAPRTVSTCRSGAEFPTPSCRTRCTFRNRSGRSTSPVFIRTRKNGRLLTS